MDKVALSADHKNQISQRQNEHKDDHSLSDHSQLASDLSSNNNLISIKADLIKQSNSEDVQGKFSQLHTSLLQMSSKHSSKLKDYYLNKAQMTLDFKENITSKVNGIISQIQSL